jgi:hypothetical protein
LHLVDAACRKKRQSAADGPTDSPQSPKCQALICKALQSKASIGMAVAERAAETTTKM